MYCSGRRTVKRKTWVDDSEQTTDPSYKNIRRCPHSGCPTKVPICFVGATERLVCVWIPLIGLFHSKPQFVFLIDVPIVTSHVSQFYVVCLQNVWSENQDLEIENAGLDIQPPIMRDPLYTSSTK
jgi:hypothetical protein